MKCSKQEATIKKMEAKILIAIEEQGVATKIQKLVSKVEELKVCINFVLY